MKIAFINPFAHPDVLPNTHYHLLLAQYVLNNAWYRTRWLPENRPSEDFIILDNGAAEGAQLSPEEIIAACQRVEPDVLILPDVLGDSAKTSALSKAFLESKPWRHLWSKPELMFVPQGEGYEAWCKCLQRVDFLPACIPYIGLAKRYSTNDFVYNTSIEGRLTLADVVSALYPKKKQHLLGLIYPQELLAFCNCPNRARNVVGIDTAMPWVLTQHSITLPEFGLLYRPKDWHSDEGATFNTYQLERAQTNARVLMQWAGGI